MNLRDMLNSIEEASPMAYDDPQTAEKPVIEPKQSQVAQRSAKAQGTRTSEFNHGEFNKFMMTNYPKVTFGMLATGNNLIAYQNKYLNSMKGGVEETIDLDERELSEVISDISHDVLKKTLGSEESADDAEVTQLKRALTMVDSEKGLNKTFMPVMKKFLRKYAELLGAGGQSAYAQIDSLHKQKVDPAMAQDQQPQDAEPFEPTDSEIKDYGVKNDLDVVSPEQMKNVKDKMQYDKEKADQDAEKNQKLAASKKNEMSLLKKLAGLTEAEDDMPSKPQVMKFCKDGMSVSEICNKFPDCDQDKLKELYKDCKDALKQKDQVEMSEAMSDVYGSTVSEESEERVTYSKTKKDGDATVTVSANADSMEELHKVLKLAGITLPKSDSEPEMHDEPEIHDEPEAPCGSEEPEDNEVTIIKPNDASYSTDKEVLVNYLKDKLKKSIS